MSLSGDVRFNQAPSTQIKTEFLLFDQDTDLVSVSSPSVFTSATSQINSQSFNYHNTEKTGEFKQIFMQLFDSHRFVTADKLLQINSQEQRLKNFSFTSCEPEDKAWALKSSSLHLNHEIGLGVAKNAKIYLFDIPIFYFPYFQFPINDNRHSGILMPSLALSNSTGTSVSVPVYWNIHPQFDSTIMVNFYSARGLQINTENRYLTASSSGVLSTSNLDDRETNGQRYFYHLKQQSQLANNLNLSLLAQSASELEFFDDFGDFNSDGKRNFLERHFILRHQYKHWQSEILMQNHQVLNLSKSIADRPYDQLPKISSNGVFKLFDGNTQLSINQSFIRFNKDASVNGDRLIFNPIIRHEWNNNYAYIKPQFEFSYTQYHLTQIDNSHDTLTRSIGSLSIDSGLFFERVASIEHAWLQTLEPRLFYLHTPYKDQSNIPDFDSALLSNNYANLFSTNRFSGGDRIGDTHQITLGISSQLLDLNSGLELLRFSVGQSYYANDRKVQLSSSYVDSNKTSDLFLELASQPNQYWRISANVTQQAATGFNTQRTVQLSRQKNGHIFNLSYRFKGDENTTELEQSDVSLVYPINNQWQFFAKRQFSLKDEQIVEQLIGARYDSCCWQFSVIAIENSDDDFVELDRSIYFQFSLKGLTNIGQSNDKLLQKSIAGYQY